MFYYRKQILKKSTAIITGLAYSTAVMLVCRQVLLCVVTEVMD